MINFFNDEIRNYALIMRDSYFEATKLFLQIPYLLPTINGPSLDSLSGDGEPNRGKDQWQTLDPVFPPGSEDPWNNRLPAGEEKIYGWQCWFLALGASGEVGCLLVRFENRFFKVCPNWQVWEMLPHFRGASFGKRISCFCWMEWWEGVFLKGVRTDSLNELLWPGKRTADLGICLGFEGWI